MPPSNPSTTGLAQLTRRNAITLGGGGLFGIGLPQFFEAQAAATPLQRRIKSCILVFYYGGPSHLDTFDMKPDAPAEVRGEFHSIATSVPGLFVGEHLPNMARVMHKVALIRSMRHTMRGHDSASYRTLTGRIPPVGDNQNFGERPDSFPSHGAVLSYLQRDRQLSVPHATLPYVMNNNLINPGQTSGFLGPVFQPFRIHGDPATLSYRANVLRLVNEVTPNRLQRRERLLTSLTGQSPSGVSAGSMSAYYDRAFDLLGSGTIREAIEISRESSATRTNYGHGPAGQEFNDNPKSPIRAELAIARNLRGFNLLLARRLVEAGVPFVNVYDYKQQGKNWDSHAKNFEYLRKHLIPPADKSLAALIEDLDDRGLLETTLVVAIGEFGRTPKINKNAGRDHWPDCYTALLAGGGIKGGFVHGASDRLGAYPTIDPVSPADLAATIFTMFGISPLTEVHDASGRPYRVAEGRSINEVLT
ncbi:MAG: DUF1501 domain-containing protein [Planctomycetaceae bacterium]